MLTLNREKQSDEQVPRGYASTLREKPLNTYDAFKTLEEDNQRYKHENKSNEYQEDLWKRLNTSSKVKTFDTNKREQNSKSLPLYNTNYDTPNAGQSATLKSKHIVNAKKKGNTTGKVILAVYMVVIILVATLVIVNAGIGSANAVSKIDTEKTGEQYAYAQSVDEPAESTNWFDKVCDFITNVTGG